MKKIISLALASILAIGLLAGCSPAAPADTSTDAETQTSTVTDGNTSDNSSSEVPELVITMRTDWYKAGWEAIEEDINSNAEELGFSIKIDKIAGGADGDNVLKARFATDDLPDFVLQSSVYSQVADYGGADLIVPIDGAWTENFPSDLIDSRIGSHDGEVYGIPVDPTQLVGAFYNKDVFEEAGITEVPKTWDEFLSACEKIKAIGKTPVYYSGADAWTVTMLVNEGFIQESIENPNFFEDLNSNNTKFADASKIEDSIQKAKELVDLGYVQESFLSDTYDMKQEALANGDAGMIFQATWVIDEIANKFPDQVENIGAFAIPLGEEIKSSSFAPFMMMMTTGCEDTEAGMKFVEYMGSVETQQKMADAQPGLWTCIGVESELFPAVADMKTYIDNNDISVWYGNLMNYPQDVAFATYVQAHLADSMTSSEVLQVIDEEMASQAKAAGDENFQ